MRALHRHLAAVFGAWLVCQSCALALAPIAMSIALHDPEPECTCDHPGATICPMHHRPSGKSKTKCACRSTSDDGAVTLASLVGPAAVAVDRFAVAIPAPSTARTHWHDATFVNASGSPDPPPPRA